MIKKFREYFKESISFPTSEDQIVQLCKKYKIKNYSINTDLSIDVDGDADLNNLKLTSLPLKFSIVIGDFYCHSNQLTSLEGSPREVGVRFYCQFNQLTTLEGGPIEVRGDFSCSNNQLTSLEGSPREVGGNFDCYNNNQLTSLKGSPREVGGYFDCRNSKLNTLEGGPREVGGRFTCSYNPVGEILNKFPEDLKKVLNVWDDFDVVRNGNELSAYRFKELYLYMTGEEFKGDMKFRGYKVVE